MPCPCVSVLSHESRCGKRGSGPFAMRRTSSLLSPLKSFAHNWTELLDKQRKVVHWRDQSTNRLRRLVAISRSRPVRSTFQNKTSRDELIPWEASMPLPRSWLHLDGTKMPSVLAHRSNASNCDSSSKISDRDDLPDNEFPQHVKLFRTVHVAHFQM